MKKYYIQDYENIDFFETIEEAIAANQGLSAFQCYICSSIFDIETKERVDLKPFIEIINLSIEEQNEIENEIEKKIKGQENFFSRLSVGTSITGFFPYDREDKQKLIDKEIEIRSYKWK